MLKVNGLSDYSKQNLTLVTTDGENIVMAIEYKPQQKGWFFTELSYGDFTINNMRITTGPNIIRQFKNKVPFGICVVTNENQEPTEQQDFASGRSKMYVLTAEEVQQYEDYLNGVQ